ncbi:MAG: hypothetical protein LBI42_14420 [Chitinispirillales bacterium]|jgi:hypothetical protein|nr:hypothetical protein [Chitinispirillales bacterium]
MSETDDFDENLLERILNEIDDVHTTFQIELNSAEIQKIRREDLELSLSNSKTVKFDYTFKDGGQEYNGFEIWYDKKVNWMAAAQERLIREDFGDLQNIYFRIIKYADSYKNLADWTPLPPGYIPGYDVLRRSTHGAFSMEINNHLTPWVFCGLDIWDNFEFASKLGINYVANQIARGSLSIIRTFF